MFYILRMSQMFLMETFPGSVLMKTYYEFLQCHDFLHRFGGIVKPVRQLYLIITIKGENINKTDEIFYNLSVFS